MYTLDDTRVIHPEASPCSDVQDDAEADELVDGDASTSCFDGSDGPPSPVVAVDPHVDGELLLRVPAGFSSGADLFTDGGGDGDQGASARSSSMVCRAV